MKATRIAIQRPAIEPSELGIDTELTSGPFAATALAVVRPLESP